MTIATVPAPVRMNRDGIVVLAAVQRIVEVTGRLVT